MEETVQQLIESKMKLAESQEGLLIKSQLQRDLSETLSQRQNEIGRMQAEIQSLYDSISQLSEERNSLILLMEDSPRAGSIQSLDTVEEEYHNLERNYSKSYTELWTAICRNWNKVKTSKKLKSLCKKGIPSAVRPALWVKAIGNRLNITPVFYEILVPKAKNSEKKCEIPNELKRTLNSTQVDNLSEVLECFAVIFK